jgi:hypothetical protein
MRQSRASDTSLVPEHPGDADALILQRPSPNFPRIVPVQHTHNCGDAYCRSASQVPVSVTASVSVPKKVCHVAVPDMEEPVTVPL